MYVLTDRNYFVGKDFRGRPIAVTAQQKALTFKTKKAANNFLKDIPDYLKAYMWEPHSEDDAIIEVVSEIRPFGNHSKSTVLEEESFDICTFFTEVIDVMSQLERFISNMMHKEQIVDMKIMDVRHYLRNDENNLNAVQMQRLGYYLQELERERYDYKSKRLIAAMFVNSGGALKDEKSIDKMEDILTSKYEPRILENKDIEEIINKKKDVEFIA